MTRIFGALMAASLLVPMELRAQTPGAGGVVGGRVTQAGDTTIGVGGAEVEIVGTSLHRYANGEGLYRFTDVPAGSYELRVRMIAYQPASLRVVVEEGRSLQQNVSLLRLPNALTEVRIEGRLLPVPARFEAVYARAARSNGKFFSRQDIQQLNPYDVKSLLNLVPTVQTNDRGITFQRCQAGLSGQSIAPGLKNNAGNQQAKVQIYIDGTRMTGRAFSSSDSTGPGNEARDVLRLVNPRDIEAMEVYSGVARIPAEFLNDACAVIAIWTKSY
jgi:hypothetical protein